MHRVCCLPSAVDDAKRMFDSDFLLLIAVVTARSLFLSGIFNTELYLTSFLTVFFFFFKVNLTATNFVLKNSNVRTRKQ